MQRINKIQTNNRFGFLPTTRIACCVLAMICLIGRVSAQFQIPFLNYSMKNGLVQNQVSDIFQDNKGYISMATDGGGLTVYDGKTLHTYTTDDGLASNHLKPDGFNTEPAEFSFTVRRPLWATCFAYISYVILLGALIYLYMRWHERWLRERNRNLEKRIHERTLELQIQKQEILEANKAMLEAIKLLEEHKNELIIQRDQIALQRHEIMDSIYYAEKIQKAIMPNHSRMNEIFDNHFVFFRPLNVVSGDYYWATRKGNKTVVVAADCTGHGVPGAFLSMLGITLLNEIVLKREINTASEILDELRENIKFTLSQNGPADGHRDGMDMALCIIDHEAMELRYAGAFNPLYLVRQGELIECKADKMPVGIFIVGGEKKFTNHRFPLQHGDTLYMFSDGYANQFGGENNTKFKSRQFRQLLVKISSLPMERQKELLIETHEQWKGDGEQIDDILVIGIQIN